MLRLKLSEQTRRTHGMQRSTKTRKASRLHIPNSLITKDHVSMFILKTEVVHIYLAPSILGLWFSGIRGYRTSSKQRAAFFPTLVVVMHHIGGSQLTRFEPESSKCWGWPQCQLTQFTCAWPLQIVIQLSNCSNLTAVLTYKTKKYAKMR